MARVSTPVSRKAGSRADARTGDASLPAISYERHPGAATDPLPGTYRRREPEKRVLHTVVREHLETFLEQARDSGGEGYPYFIEGEFRRYLGCGILSRGFARVRCHLKLPTTPPPLAAPRDMWEPESNLLIPPMDEHGIDERDLAGTDEGAQRPVRTPRPHPDAARSPP